MPRMTSTKVRIGNRIAMLCERNLYTAATHMAGNKLRVSQFTCRTGYYEKWYQEDAEDFHEGENR